MIELKDVLAIHNILIDKFGGSKGVRDSGSLEWAINRPYATFDNQDLYSTPSDKATAMLNLKFKLSDTLSLRDLVAKNSRHKVQKIHKAMPNMHWGTLADIH